MMQMLATIVFRANRLGVTGIGGLFLCSSGIFTAAGGDQIEAALPGQEASWQLRDSLPEGAVFAGTVAGNDGRIYVMSGFKGPDTEKLSSANRVYDPSTDRWTLRAPVPTPRGEPGAAAGSDGTIYRSAAIHREAGSYLPK